MIRFTNHLTLFSLVSTNHLLSEDYERTLQEDINIISDSVSIKLFFTKPGKYVIYEGNSPSTINWNSPIKINGSTITIKRNFPRPFYAVVTPTNETLLIAERKLMFSNLDNFRDLGGLKTKDNRYINWGRFYRSDALNELATSEFNYVENLNIQRVFDLRSDFEIKNANDNLPNTINYQHFPIFADNDSGMLKGLKEKISGGSLKKADAEQLLMDTYISFVDEDASKFNDLLHQIFIEFDYPSVFHCTAGKDRTGFTAAMILSILNVDRKTILEEYEMTNFYTKTKIEKLMNNVSKLGYGDKIEPDAIEAIMSVNKKYLEASFDIIDKKYEGIDNFIKNQLGFSDSERAELIKKFTYKL